MKTIFFVLATLTFSTAFASNVEILCQSISTGYQSFVLKSLHNLDFNGPANRPNSNWKYTYTDGSGTPTFDVDISVNDRTDGLVFTVSSVSASGHLNMIRDIEVLNIDGNTQVFSREIADNSKRFQCKARYSK